MDPRLSIIVIVLALMAGAVAIFLVNRLMRKYPLPYLSSYFYYLIFTYIFGAYSIIGSQVIQILLSDPKIAAETVRSAAVFLLVLGIPFLILSWYMFLRLTHEFFQKQLTNIFIYSYFTISLVLFLVYTLLNIYDGNIGSISFFPSRQEIIYIFSGLHVLLMGYGLFYVFILNRETKDVNQRQAFSWFATWYSLILILNILSLSLMAIHQIFGLLFILGYLGFHLIPVLFLHLYLQKHYVAKVENENFADNMSTIIGKFGISKRETEVFELICKGMTNQEISDSLFISVQTVKDHIYRIFLKTGVKNRVQLTNLLGK